MQLSHWHVVIQMYTMIVSRCNVHNQALMSWLGYQTPWRAQSAPYEVVAHGQLEVVLVWQCSHQQAWAPARSSVS